MNAYSILFTYTIMLAHTHVQYIHTETHTDMHTYVHIERHSTKSPHAKQIAKNIIIDSKIILLLLSFYLLPLGAINRVDDMLAHVVHVSFCLYLAVRLSL